MGYFGSKGASGAFQAVIAQMPPHDVYIEAFAGSAVVLKAKPPAARSIAIDLDPRAIAALDRQLPRARQDVELVHGDAVGFLEAFAWPAGARVLVYADPPYLLSTRRSAKRYACDFEDADHVRLLGVLRQLPCAVILSGYPSALYDELVGDWRTCAFQVMTRGGPRTEKLWMNYPAGAVAWSSFAGRGFTDRQRIKRKAANWARMYAVLPPGERLAILAALLAQEAAIAVPAAPATIVAGD